LMATDLGRLRALALAKALAKGAGSATATANVTALETAGKTMTQRTVAMVMGSTTPAETATEKGMGKVPVSARAETGVVVSDRTENFWSWAETVPRECPRKRPPRSRFDSCRFHQ
jgi:hypothetical protein